MPLEVLPNSGHWSYWHPVDPDTQPSGSLNNQECCPNSCVPTVTLGNAGNSLPYFLQTFPVYSASSPPTPADRLDDCLGPCVLSPQLGFEDLIAEPENTHSFDKVWICSHALYEISKYVIYKFLTVFLAIPLAFVAGILFATLSCLHIWWEGTQGWICLLKHTDVFATCPLLFLFPRPCCRKNACISSQAVARPEEAWGAVCFL